LVLIFFFLAHRAEEAAAPGLDQALDAGAAAAGVIGPAIDQEL
jgi:hypothetical protein